MNIVSRLKSLHLLLLAISVVAIAAVACGGDDEPAATAVRTVAPIIQTVVVTVEVPVEKIIVATPVPGFLLQAPEPNPKYGGHIKTAWGATMRDFDIYQGGSPNVLSQMYDNLVRRNPTDGLQSIIPDLATNWSISDDGMQYTFTLREGVKWHDGMPFTSADVVATFRRVLNPPTGVIIPLKSLYDAIGSVEAPDDFTVVFTLTKARVWQFDMFSDVGSVIYPKHVLDANGGDLRTVIAPGTGAMMFDDKQDGEFWRFKRNDDYWNPKLPYLDFATMLHIPAWTDRGTAVLTGVADLSWNVSRDTFKRGLTSTTVQVRALPNFGFLEVRWNNEKPPFNDVRVRRAMHLAFNRHVATDVYQEETLTVSRWTNGEGRTPDSETFQMPGYRKTGEGYEEDVAEAKRLMAEAGFPDGAGLPDFTLVTASVPGHAEILAPFFAAQMAQIGLKINIRTVERSLVNEEYKKDFDFVLGTVFHSPTPNHTPMWQTVFTCGASQNFGRYCNEEFDAVVDQLNAEGDSEARKALWVKGQDILDNDPPEVHFGYTAHMPMWQNYVKGLNFPDRLHQEWGRYSTTVWLDK